MVDRPLLAVLSYSCILLNACNYAIIKSTELLNGWRTVIRQKQFRKLKDLVNLITVARIDEI